MNRLEIAVNLYTRLAGWSDDAETVGKNVDRCLVLADMFIRRNHETSFKRPWDGPSCHVSELTLDMVCQHSDWRAGDFITCLRIVREITGACLSDVKNWCDAHRKELGCAI
jgi:hypothetical protein